ncbi:MAG: 30S ribosome-binding factor RbfA [Bdellovibrionaceae bacterium]|nr:30S ribosome-binding factor RbfA [Pseudobdellovibrionaceae bacterium]
MSSDSSSGSGRKSTAQSAIKAGEVDLRVVRVGKAIRDIIAQAVIRGLRDVPRGPVTVTRVDCQRDFRAAKVYVSIFLPDDLSADKREEKIDSILFAFEDAADELRRLMNDQLRMKHIPYLEFVLDTGVEKMIHVTEVLKGVRSEGEDE